MDFKTMTLTECGKFDAQNNLRAKTTAWGIICFLRNKSGNSRRLRILRREGKRGGRKGGK